MVNLSSLNVFSILGLQQMTVGDSLIVIGVLIVALVIIIVSLYKMKKENVFSDPSISAIRKYIIRELSRGYTESEIKKKLSDVGWDSETVIKAFKFSKP